MFARGMWQFVILPPLPDSARNSTDDGDSGRVQDAIILTRKAMGGTNIG